MSTPLPEPTDPDAAEHAPPARDATAEPSIWGTLSDEDRAALERALARSKAGIFASDEEVEAAFATFGP